VLHPTKLNATLTYGGASSGGLTFTATYNGLSFGSPPTGTVALSSGGASLGTGTLAAATDGSGNYIATITSSSAPSGPTVSAQFSGDGNYAAETTTITFQQPSYKVSAAPPSLTIQQGSSGSVTFTVTPQNGFNEQVSFACDASTLPMGVTCSFSPASVTPDGIDAATTTLTVQTTGASIAAIDRSKAKPPGWLPRGGAMLALVVLLVPPMRRKAWLTGLTVLLFAVCLGGVSGCGGGGSNSSGSSQNPNATPLGSYVIHVNSSAGSPQGAAPITVSLTVTG
jgi:hypothetical protein